CEALQGSSYAPLAARVGKLLEEERIHAAHGVAWFRRLAGASDEARTALADAAAAIFPGLLRWFGPEDGRTALLAGAGVIDRGAGLRGTVPSFEGFDEARRRVSPEGPDAATVARIRGDKNRAFLVD